MYLPLRFLVLLRQEGERPHLVRVLLATVVRAYAVCLGLLHLMLVCASMFRCIFHLPTFILIFILLLYHTNHGFAWKFSNRWIHLFRRTSTNSQIQLHPHCMQYKTHACFLWLLNLIDCILSCRTLADNKPLPLNSPFGRHDYFIEVCFNACK